MRVQSMVQMNQARVLFLPDERSGHRVQGGFRDLACDLQQLVQQLHSWGEHDWHMPPSAVHCHLATGGPRTLARPFGPTNWPSWLQTDPPSSAQQHLREAQWRPGQNTWDKTCCCHLSPPALHVCPRAAVTPAPMAPLHHHRTRRDISLAALPSPFGAVPTGLRTSVACACLSLRA